MTRRLHTESPFTASASKSHGRLRSLVGKTLVVCACAAAVGSARAGTPEEGIALNPAASGDDWKFSFDLYLWAAGVDTTTANGVDINLGSEELADNMYLNMAAMFNAQVAKGPWSLGTDFIYLDLGTSLDIARKGLATEADVNLVAWMMTPEVGYTLSSGEWGNVGVVAGARYLSLDEDSTLRFTVGGVAKELYSSSSVDSWAGVVGLRGCYNLSERWFLPYYFDIGTGQPDLTWQAFLGMGYHFGPVDAVLGYRHLDFQFDSSVPNNHLDVSGPILGFGFDF